MAMLEMLAEVVRSEEFLDVIAFTEFMHGSQMLKTLIPVWFRVIGKLLATVATRIMSRARTCLRYR
jgi:hypothetical protein